VLSAELEKAVTANCYKKHTTLELTVPFIYYPWFQIKTLTEKKFKVTSAHYLRKNEYTSKYPLETY
jgi:hypothetical protein